MKALYVINLNSADPRVPFCSKTPPHSNNTSHPQRRLASGFLHESGARRDQPVAADDDVEARQRPPGVVRLRPGALLGGGGAKMGSEAHAGETTHPAHQVLGGRLDKKPTSNHA